MGERERVRDRERETESQRGRETEKLSHSGFSAKPSLLGAKPMGETTWNVLSLNLTETAQEFSSEAGKRTVPFTEFQSISKL